MRTNNMSCPHILTYILTFVLYIISAFSINAQGNASNELTLFVDNATKQLNASSVKIPQFDKANIDTIQDLGKINGNTLYLCWLKNEKERTGYIAVAGNGKTFQVVAFSATTAGPDYFLKKLQIDNSSGRTLDFSKAKQISFVENVPLVATAKTLIGTDPIEISEIAASLSSIFNYLQNKDKIMFFGHLDSGIDPEYTRRFKEDPNSAKYPTNPAWKSFQKESEEAREKENISRGQTSEEKANSRSRQRNVIKPIVRQRLLNPVNARERVEVINAETSAIDRITLVNISSGMKDAVLLQQDYLEENTSKLKNNLDIFFKTRGREAQIEIEAFRQLNDDSLPAIAIGPENIAVVLLGFLDIDGEKYASIFFPQTGKPYTMSLTQKLREIRIANNLPAEPNWETDKGYQDALKRAKEAEEKLKQAYLERGLSYPAPEKNIEERVREGVERIQTSNDKTLVVEDMTSKYPESLIGGIQIIKYSSLTSWQVLNISKIEVGNNW
jgi:hypothetical protein